jgi:hypothetical protein
MSGRAASPRCSSILGANTAAVRHSLYDLEGEHFADLPEWGFRSKNGWAVKNAIEAACPVAKFEFADFDGERIIATTRIEEREWKRGKGLFRLFFLGRNRIGRSLDLSFSAEVGKRSVSRYPPEGPRREARLGGNRG